MLDKKHILNRFIGYVKIDTESDPNSISTPSTEKQWDLANKLADELKTIGMQDVSIDDNAYIMATLPSNVDSQQYQQLDLYLILILLQILQLKM